MAKKQAGGSNRWGRIQPLGGGEKASADTGKREGSRRRIEKPPLRFSTTCRWGFLISAQYPIHALAESVRETD